MFYGRHWSSVVESSFQVKVNMEVEEYLGLRMERLANGDVKITQPQLLQSLFTEYADLIAAHRTRGLLSAQRSPSTWSRDATPMDQSEYLHLEGALIYLTKSRPDIQTAVSFGATFSASPTQGAFDELIHCLKYLQDTASVGLIIKAGQPFRELHLLCYVDASYLTHADSKSHQGYCLSFGEIGSFYSKSSKQQLVATSSTHAELRALYALTVDIIFIVELCKELGRPVVLPATVFEDNGAVIALSKEMTSRAKRCKHFLMLVDWIREQVSSGIIELAKVASPHNRANILTKIVTGMPYRDAAGNLLGADLYH